MLNRNPDDDLLFAAASRTPACPPVEQLETLVDQQPSSQLQHVNGCVHCQTELQLLRSFTANEVAKHEASAVDSIVARLKAQSSEIVSNRIAVDVAEPWWKRILSMPWLTPATVALAAVLVVAGVALQLRQGRRPSLDTPANGSEILRSSALAILSPTGDLRETPSEIQWEPVGNATRYRVTLMEVDRAELFSGETAVSQMALNAEVKKLIVPSKTLLLEVKAYDSSGREIAKSEPTRFRLLQGVYTR